jgi:hypothetical protein
VNWAVWVVLAIAGIILCLSAAIAGRSPRFWYGMGTILIEEGLPKAGALWKAYKARHTDAEWKDIRDRWDREKRPNR